MRKDFFQSKEKQIGHKNWKQKLERKKGKRQNNNLGIKLRGSSSWREIIFIWEI